MMYIKNFHWDRVRRKLTHDGFKKKGVEYLSLLMSTTRCRKGGNFLSVSCSIRVPDMRRRLPGTAGISYQLSLNSA